MADIHFAFGAKLLPAEVTLNIFEDKIQVHLRTVESKVGSTCISYQTFQWILSVYLYIYMYVDIISIYYAGVDKCHATLKSTLKSMFNVFKFQHVCNVVTPS